MCVEAGYGSFVEVSDRWSLLDLARTHERIQATRDAEADARRKAAR